MKKGLFFAIVLVASMATTYSQTKIQFVEAKLGQAIMSGYSLFDKAIGDNHAFSELIHVGWGKDASRSIGACLGIDMVSMPNYDETAAAFTLAFDIRRYLEVSPGIRFHSGVAIGGVYVANGYTITGEKKYASRFGLSATYSMGTEMYCGEHLYLGASIHFTVSPVLISTFEPSGVTPDKGGSVFWGNKIMLTAGYRL
ncbi:MAG: hypothetical protein AUK63_809 [bacterium P3]|nr:MAG: hypothetical protein AUK63_809 [bacterium P3]KWW41878.1 MAG: hypothetical protein F083_806 [bacterium F083]